MARLLRWPEGLDYSRWKPLNGPQSIGGVSNTSIGNVTQTVASPFGARHIMLMFPPIRGQLARRARGLVTALHQGANAVRVKLSDPDGLSFAEAGAAGLSGLQRNGVAWSNGRGFSNGKTWRPTRPVVKVSSATPFDETIVTLSNAFWGHKLGMGDMIGFFPFHFGAYEVTEVIEPGKYRVWPPLRKAIGTKDYATLDPVMAMRLLSNNLPDAERSPQALEGLSISLFEVFDYDVRDYFQG